MKSMQTYVAEINGRAVFAFRSVDASCAQAWLDIHGLMRRMLEQLQSDGRAICDGRSAIVARKATSDESATWTQSCGRAIGAEHLDEPDNITVWLIPNPTEPS
ncbi:MAG TPA: hypothetical protein VGY14_02895 [Methyloceanibacter sp.]|jgi:hypothetical protein|nr:hypothetical protein [Methyloceanibacter sp.]